MIRMMCVRPTVLVCIYRRDTTFILQFSEFVEQYIICSSGSFLLCGDFNIHWNNPNHDYTCQFKHVMEEYNLSSSIPNSATHRLGNTIDFILSDDQLKNDIFDVNTDSGELLSGHFPVSFSHITHALHSSNVAEPTLRRNSRSIDLTNFKIDVASVLAERLHNGMVFPLLVKGFNTALKE